MALVQPGRMLYEMQGVDELIARESVPAGIREIAGKDHIRDSDGGVMNAKRVKGQERTKTSVRSCSSSPVRRSVCACKPVRVNWRDFLKIKAVRRDIARVKTIMK